MKHKLHGRETFIQERLALLEQASLKFTYDTNDNSINLTSLYLSLEQREVLTFAQMLTYAIDLSVLNKSLCRSALELHYKFWKERVDA